MTEDPRTNDIDETRDETPAPEAQPQSPDPVPTSAADQPTAVLPTTPAQAATGAEPPPPPGGDLPPAGGGGDDLPPPPPGDGESPESQSYQRWVIGGLIAFLLFITIIGLVFFVGDDDDDDDVAKATETVIVPTATTVAVAATETPTPEPPTATVAEPTSTPTAEPTATETPEPTATATPKPTETPKPEPTATSTPEPEPTPTPKPQPPTPTPKPEPTATEVPTAPKPSEGALVYSANWSAGADDWDLGEGWAVTGSALVADGADAGPQLAPFNPTGPDYAVEAQIAIVGSNSCDEVAGVFARAAQATDVATPLYSGYAGNACAHEWRIDAIAQNDPATLTNGYRPLDTTAHTYRLEVKGERIRLFIDGKFAGEATDGRFSSPRGVGLYLHGDTQIMVRSFRVYSLS